jgi:hypothetical protein
MGSVNNNPGLPQPLLTNLQNQTTINSKSSSLLSLVGRVTLGVIGTVAITAAAVAVVGLGVL